MRHNRSLVYVPSWVLVLFSSPVSILVSRAGQALATFKVMLLVEWKVEKKEAV